jgi:hypothetical protein
MATDQGGGNRRGWHLLDPIDLYVRHTFGPINAIVRHFLPLLEPTRHDETLAKFSNYHELWATG